ncbi:MAG TPA: hypothetical protein PLZ57_07495 [Pseudobdellovibrionaceae bacterium]|nr:hypothetical protein [Pseudobdellovibrionaceae bacterium]
MLSTRLNRQILAVILISIPSLTHAMTGGPVPAAAGAAVGGAAGAAGAVAPGAGAAIAPANTAPTEVGVGDISGGTGAGAGQPTVDGGMTTAVPVATTGPTAAPAPGAGVPGMMAPSSTAMWLQLCAMMSQGLMNSMMMRGDSPEARRLREIRDAADRANDEAGWQPDDRYRGEEALRLGREAEAAFGRGCHQFIRVQGDQVELGPWGRTLLNEIENHREVYQREEADLNLYCPGFGQFNEARRTHFRVWMFMSMASAESSCNPGTTAQAVNGQATGLFQLEPNACPGETNQSLLNPHVNSRCAVNRLARELRQRDTLMIGRVRNARGGTQSGSYWGVLRNDDANSARGCDIIGAWKTRSLMCQFNGCQVGGRKTAECERIDQLLGGNRCVNNRVVPR